MNTGLEIGPGLAATGIALKPKESPLEYKIKPNAQKRGPCPMSVLCPSYERTLLVHSMDFKQYVKPL